jgi:hypothetical protein
MNPSPVATDLRSVEEAKEELKDKFVNLDDLLQVDYKPTIMSVETGIS